MFRYRLHSPGGDELGEATYLAMFKPGAEVIVDNGRRFRVLAIVPFPQGRTSRRCSGCFR